MDIHTRQLRYFMELANCLNFTKAAMNLYIAQPALSQQIADLERQLGVTLFERNSRSVVLTPAGKILQSACPDILNKLDSVKQQVLCAQAGLRGSLKIGYSEVFQHLLPSIVQEFRRFYPDVALEFYSGNVKELKSSLENKDVDIIFGCVNSQVLPQNDPPSYNVLWKKDLCIVVHRDHPFVSSGCTDYSLLENEIFIIIDESIAPALRSVAEKSLGEIGLAFNKRAYAKTYGSIMIQIEAGMGVSILPSVMKFSLFASPDNVVFIPIRKECVDFGVAWYGTSTNAALPLFLDLLGNTVDTIPDQ